MVISLYVSMLKNSGPLVIYIFNLKIVIIFTLLCRGRCQRVFIYYSWRVGFVHKNMTGDNGKKGSHAFPVIYNLHQAPDRAAWDRTDSYFQGNHSENDSGSPVTQEKQPGTSTYYPTK